MHEALPFLTAAWRELAVANYEIDRRALVPLVPAGTELDDWHGTTLVSLVGFQFRDARVLGWSLPGHRNFPEVNLRFYVRRKMPNGWRRAVVFVKELAPRRLVAWTARWFFGENYVTVPMRCESNLHEARHSTPQREIAYRWSLAASDYRFCVIGQGAGHLAAPLSQEEFIIEHYWAYTRINDRATMEYRVDHPRWRLWTAAQASFQGNAALLYGDRFAAALSAPPVSAFVADGSAVTVMRGSKLDGAADPIALRSDGVDLPASSVEFVDRPLRRQQFEHGQNRTVV